MHPPTALGTLPADYCLGPVDLATLPDAADEEILSEEEAARQEALDAMPAAEDMLLVDDFELWAEKVLTNMAWAYYRSASDYEACGLSPLCRDLQVGLADMCYLPQPFTRTETLTNGTSSALASCET